MKKLSLKQTINILGSLLMAASIAFIARQLWLMREDIDFAAFSNPLLVVALVLLATYEALAMLLNALNYRALIFDVSGIKAKNMLAVRVYTIANMFKYIPGGVMYVIGRNKLAVEIKELSHTKVAAATVAEGVLWAISGAIISAAYAFNHSLSYIREIDSLPLIGTIAAILLSTITLFAFIFRNKLAKTWHKFKAESGGLNRRTTIKRIAAMFVIMNFWSVTFVLTVMLLGQTMNVQLAFTLMGLYILSWTAGFLTPGAPSGLGIREFVLLTFMAGTVDEGILLSAIITHRALQVAGDVLAYVAVYGAEKIHLLRRDDATSS